MRSIALIILLTVVLSVVGGCGDSIGHWESRELAAHDECQAACERLDRCGTLPVDEWPTVVECTAACQESTCEAVNAEGKSCGDHPIGTDAQLQACIDAFDAKQCGDTSPVSECLGLIY